MGTKNILDLTRALRSCGHHDAAFDLIRSKLDQRDHGGLIWAHSPFFWLDISAGTVRLTRRHSGDQSFMRTLWAHPGFLRAFNRQAGVLPVENEALSTTLDNEYLATLYDLPALHWIVRNRAAEPWGLLSLIDVSLQHKRAEVLLGMHPSAPSGLSVAAMLLLFEYYFKVMRFNKLYSYVYEDNPRSLKSTLHLGFRAEGKLIQEVFDSEDSEFKTITRTAILAHEAFSNNNRRLMRRVLVNKS